MLGAILRTAAAFGVDALVMTERHAPELAGVVAKAASGGLEHVAIVRVVNLARALEQLGEMGYLRLGLDSEAASELGDDSIAAASSRWCSAARARGCAVSAGRIAMSWCGLTCPARSRASMFQMPAPWR